MYFKTDTPKKKKKKKDGSCIISVLECGITLTILF